MDYTGNMVFNCFPGDEERKLNPMTRAVVDIKEQKYVFYLNELEGGVLVAAHHAAVDADNKLTVNRNPIAQAACDEIEGLEGVEYAFSITLDNGYRMNDFVISEVRTNKNGTDYRLGQPLFVAKIRAKAVEKTPAAAPKTGTDDAASF